MPNPQPPVPEWAPTHRHRKTGKLVRLLQSTSYITYFEDGIDWRNSVLTKELDMFYEPIAPPDPTPAVSDPPAPASMAEIREAIAREITGSVADQCCYQTGGKGRKDDKHCECREIADAIIAILRRLRIDLPEE